MKIAIFFKEDLEDLVSPLLPRLSAVFGGARVSREAWRPFRRRSPEDASFVLRQLPEIPGAKALGVVNFDITVPGLNFVFGLAEMGGGRAVVSVFRLQSVDEGLTRERLLKEMVHELGHTLGLGHCDNRRCVMSFSNSVMDVDMKDFTFCGRCRERVAEALSCDP